MGYSAGNKASDPAREAFHVVPQNDVKIDPPLKGLRADAAGVITIVTVGGAAAIPHPVLAGERIDVLIDEVRATGTTNQTYIVGYR